MVEPPSYTTAVNLPRWPTDQIGTQSLPINKTAGEIVQEAEDWEVPSLWWVFCSVGCCLIIGLCTISTYTMANDAKGKPQTP